jgi:hypothetical protein
MPVLTERGRSRGLPLYTWCFGHETGALSERSAPSMSNGEAKIRRTLHFKFTLTGASEQMIAMIKSAAPLYQMFGDAKVRLLQNVDDPGRFLQEIEYDAPETLEQNRQQIASDPRVQAYLQGWRSMFPGAIEFEVYKIL